jgi:hypothetical protein
MKGVEILEEVAGEIRVGNASGAATVAPANLRRAHGKIVNPVGIASEHRSPKPAESTRPTKLTKLTKLTRPTKLTRLRPLLDRPSDR